MQISPRLCGEKRETDSHGLLALERTFLAYIRTSVMIAMQGVLIAQLFRLQQSSSALDRLQFFEVGIPLSVACHCVAVLVAAIGAYRFWRQQSAISKGKVHAGGWELVWVGGFLFAVSPAFVSAFIRVADVGADYPDSVDCLRRCHRRGRDSNPQADPANTASVDPQFARADKSGSRDLAC